MAFDLETTGLDPVNDYIIEVGATQVTDGKIVARLQQFIKPPIQIPPFITKITSITNEMVKNAPTINEVFEDIYDFLGDYPLVGHNVKFDYTFIQQKRDEYDGYEMKNPLLDTLSLSRTFRYDLVNHRLGAIAESYSFDSEGAHRADFDAELTANILLKLVGEMSRADVDVFTNLVEIHRTVELPNKSLYIAVLNHLHRGKSQILPPDFTPTPVPTKPNIRDIKHEGELPTLDDIFDKDGRLSAILDGYEPRPAQYQMAKDIQRVMQNDDFLVAEDRKSTRLNSSHT